MPSIPYPIKKILLPYDGSPAARKALELAAHLSPRTSLLHHRHWSAGPVSIPGLAPGERHGPRPVFGPGTDQPRPSSTTFPSQPPCCPLSPSSMRPSPAPAVGSCGGPWPWGLPGRQRHRDWGVGQCGDGGDGGKGGLPHFFPGLYEGLLCPHAHYCPEKFCLIGGTGFQPVRSRPGRRARRPPYRLFMI